MEARPSERGHSQQCSKHLGTPVPPPGLQLCELEHARFIEVQTKAARVKQLASIHTAGQWLSCKSDEAIWL